MPNTVPIFAPDGTLGDIPAEQLAAAVQAGAKPGVSVYDPSGKLGVVPADRYVDAVKAGGRVAPFEQQEIQHPGLWHSLLGDLKNMLPNLGGPGDQPLPGRAAAGIQNQQQFEAEDQSRQQAGYSAPYRAIAPIGQYGLGVNVPGMEQSAQQGDVRGVLGHAAAVPAVMAATEGAARGFPYAQAAAPSVVRGTAKTYNVARNLAATASPVAGALEGVARLLHGDLPGAAYSTIGGGFLGKAVRVLPEAGPGLTEYGRPAPTYPGAPLPATPSLELIQAAPLAQGGAVPPPNPSAGLGTIPARSVPAPTYPGAPLPTTPRPELLQARPLAQGGAVPPSEPAAGLGRVSVRESVPAPTAPEAQPTAPQGMYRGPQPVSGESALNAILTPLDNANLMRIAKSRGISVTQEGQLKPGVANPMLIRKIADSFSADELQAIGNQYLEASRFQHQFQGITPEAWNAMTTNFYFPDVKLPAAMLKRAQASIQASHPLHAAVNDLTDILQQSVAKANKGK